MEGVDKGQYARVHGVTSAEVGAQSAPGRAQIVDGLLDDLPSDVTRADLRILVERSLELYAPREAMSRVVGLGPPALTARGVLSRRCMFVRIATSTW